MQGFQTVFLVFLAFLTGVNCVNLKNTASSENETKSTTNDRCIQKCGRNPGVVCMDDLTSNESITCNCKDETKTYDAKSQQCVDRCIQKCGKDPSIICMGDLTSDYKITCSCREENEIYDERSYQCLDRCTVKCGADSGVKCQGDQSSDETTICTCTNNTYVFSYGTCITRCQKKCGIAWCTGDQTSDNTTTCNCYPGYAYDEKSGMCDGLCKVKCGRAPYVTCEGDSTSDETTICGCGTSNLIFDEKNKTCTKRCIHKCGWDSNIKCGGDQKTDETTICGCRDSSQVYVQEIQACKTKCDCVNGICYKDENDTAICNCFPEYGLVSSLRCEECKCGKGANCTFESSSQRKKCICRDGYSEVNGICKVNDPCVPNPCQNGGQCENHNGKAKCNCIEGYTGTLCKKVNPCAPNPCKNGGLCISKKDTYKCICERNNPDKDCSGVLWCTLHGWSVCGRYATCNYNEVTGKHSCICPSNGVFDEKSKICKDVCVPNPCAHGTCLHRMGKFVCMCSGSYRGIFCNETITDPCYPNPCQSGGSCIADGLKFTCICKSTYSGSTCEKHGDKTVMTILLVALGIGVLIFASFGVFCWKRNQKLKKMSKATAVYNAPPAVILPEYPKHK